MTDNSKTPREIARSMQLRYVHAHSKGYSRIRKGKKFVYLDAEGKEIKSREILDHIAGLVLPPAWTEVWICPYPNGHLQATGYDVAGRKQYRYHSRWSKVRNDNKFDRIYAFGKKLPGLRRQIFKDIRKKTLLREKVSAIALNVMNETYIRAGNTAYEKEYGSYGLTTLKNKHVDIKSTGVFFRFRGKKGVPQQIRLKNASLARLLKNVKELPGQELFQYYDEGGGLHKLDSGDINDYLKTNMGDTFTCKDFRTWAGCMVALQLMAAAEAGQEQNRKNSIAIIDGVAEKLGNTRAICKRYYIHPLLLEAYEQGILAPILAPLRNYKDAKDHNRKTELALLRFLKALQKA
jgi:DNA topoisomerase-1